MLTFMLLLALHLSMTSLVKEAPCVLSLNKAFVVVGKHVHSVYVQGLKVQMKQLSYKNKPHQRTKVNNMAWFH